MRVPPARGVQVNRSRSCAIACRAAYRRGAVMPAQAVRAPEATRAKTAARCWRCAASEEEARLRVSIEPCLQARRNAAVVCNAEMQCGRMLQDVAAFESKAA